MPCSPPLWTFVARALWLARSAIPDKVFLTQSELVEPLNRIEVLEGNCEESWSQQKLLIFCQTVSDEILKSDVEDFGDLMLDVAEAFMAQQEFLEAIKFLENLIASENWAKVSLTDGRWWHSACLNIR